MQLLRNDGLIKSWREALRVALVEGLTSLHPCRICFLTANKKRRIVMPKNAAAMVLASFVADSLALGAHWIYDTDEIDKKIGRVDRLLQPLPYSYHKQKNKGDLTHYGDQALVLLESIAVSSGFSLSHFKDAWQHLFTENYSGYLDKATTVTLENIKNNISSATCGSTSTDLGGAARIAPLIFYYREDREKLLETVKQQTGMTHNNRATLAAAGFIGKVVFSVLHGVDPLIALEDALDEGVADLDLGMRIQEGLDSTGKETGLTIKQFGQMCGVAAALPGAIHLITTYKDDAKTALIENVMAGGDSAARGLVVGMVLGAHQGLNAIPEQWFTNMTPYGHINKLLDRCAGD